MRKIVRMSWNAAYPVQHSLRTFKARFSGRCSRLPPLVSFAATEQPSFQGTNANRKHSLSQRHWVLHWFSPRTSEKRCSMNVMNFPWERVNWKCKRSLATTLAKALQTAGLTAATAYRESRAWLRATDTAVVSSRYCQSRRVLLLM